MTEDSPEVERALSGIDESKRRTLIRLLRGAAFVVPVVASFSMDGLTISNANKFIQNAGTSVDTQATKTSGTAEPGKSFADTLNEAIGNVNELQKNSIRGDLHER